MSQPIPASQVPSLDLTAATSVARQCFGDRRLDVVAMHDLHGGMINRVQEWTIDVEPFSLVCKINLTPERPPAWPQEVLNLEQEAAALQWCRQHTRFPVPRVYGCVATAGPGSTGGTASSLTCLLMERLPGRHLGQCQLTAAGTRSIQRQMARHLAGLHEHQGPIYGYVAGHTSAGWLDWFAPKLHANFRDAFPRLAAAEQRIVQRLLEDLPQWLPEPARPTAVHGDIWAANMVVDDSRPEHPVLSGFIDGGGLFADVEYELAYMRCFPADNQAFDQAYEEYRTCAPRDGFDRRCRVYWINTILLHVWMFGAEYLPRCRQVIAEIAAMA